ncbi:MAG TPA: hypothetical protein VGC55_16080 [Dokdonella sp.]
MSHPNQNPSARLCILRYPDEVTVCANIDGFRLLGEWMAWLAASDPREAFHFHTLWHLESEASRFEGISPANVWSLSQAEQPAAPPDAPDGCKIVPFELTFHVVDDAQLDELARHQPSGLIPARFRKEYAAVEIACE